MFISFRRETSRWTFSRSLAIRQGALLGCDSHLSVIRLVHFSCCLWCRAAAELAASRKEVKYAGLDGLYLFVPIAFENFGVPSTSSRQLFSNLGRRLADVSGESRETSYLFQFQWCSHSWYSTSTLFCCMIVWQLVTARIVRHIQLFPYFLIF